MTNFNIKTIEMAGLGSALQALRLPFGNECRSNVVFECNDLFESQLPTS